jgi:hypothetical protein
MLALAHNGLRATGLARGILIPTTSSASRHVHASVPGRTGALALKAGMTVEFDSWGIRQELTVLLVSFFIYRLHLASHGCAEKSFCFVLKLDNCQVTQIKRDATEG